VRGEGGVDGGVIRQHYNLLLLLRARRRRRREQEQRGADERGAHVAGCDS